MEREQEEAEEKAKEAVLKLLKEKDE